MQNSNLNNLIFAFVVLLAVLLGGIKNESPEEAILEQKPDKTSLAAVVKTADSPDVSFFMPPNITAVSALVKDLSISEPLLALNSGQQWPIASLTKLMTAVIAAEDFPDGAKIKMSDRALATEGGAGNFIAGEFYAVPQLLNPLLKLSSNDAAEALAEFYGRENFLEKMNQKASQLGMANTRFFDPSGLSPLNQSTLQDLEKLAVYIFYRHPQIFEITREKEGNIHPFAGHPDFGGGKTGFIDEANGNLISLFNPSAGGGPLLIIILGSDDRFSDTKNLYDRFTSR